MHLIRDEKGVALVTVILILVLLTVIGVTATRTVVNEKRVIRSEAVFEQNFYNAESGALEGVQKIANENTHAELLVLVEPAVENAGLLYKADSEEPTNDTKNLDINNDGNYDSVDFGLADMSHTNSDTRRVVIEMPIQHGDSLKLGQSNLYTYMSYGVSESNRGRATVKIGYKKRF